MLDCFSYAFLSKLNWEQIEPGNSILVIEILAVHLILKLIKILKYRIFQQEETCFSLIQERFRLLNILQWSCLPFFNNKTTPALKSELKQSSSHNVAWLKLQLSPIAAALTFISMMISRFMLTQLFIFFVCGVWLWDHDYEIFWLCGVFIPKGFIYTYEQDGSEW